MGTWGGRRSVREQRNTERGQRDMGETGGFGDTEGQRNVRGTGGFGDRDGDRNTQGDPEGLGT